MTKSKAVLVATRQIIGGTDKGRRALAAGDELDSRAQKAMGLTDDAIATLREQGALREVNARVAEGDASADSAALTAAEHRAADAETKLAAETRRADDAEAKVAELTKQLEDAAKPKA